MNKLAIPAILVSIVMIAGIFAFVPVQQATTVHQQIIDAINGGNTDLATELINSLSAAQVIRIATFINNDPTNSDSTSWTQIITYDRTDGTGAWQIEKLYLCDVEITGGGTIAVGFDVETDLVGTNHGSNKPSLVSSEDQPVITGLVPGFDGNNDCVDLRTIAHNFGGGFLNDQVGHTFLGGDRSNNVNVRLQDSACDTDSFRTAVIVAYISGLVDVDDMVVTPHDDVFQSC